MADKVTIFIRTKRWFPEAKYWYVDAVVRAGSGDIVITREPTMPEGEAATDEDLAAEVAAWYGVEKDGFALGDLEDLGDDFPVLAVDSPESVPVKQGESVRPDPHEVLAKARAEQE